MNYVFPISLLLLFTLAPLVEAENFFERANRKLSEHKENRAQKKEKSKQEIPQKHRATLPDDLPKHWKLEALAEDVFNAEVLVATAGDPKKPKILLVHGLGQLGMKDWLTVEPALSGNYHVIALDLPGFGNSGSPSGRYSPSNYAAVLHRVKEYFSPDDTIIVVGHSMGGAVTLRYSSLYPEDVSSIVLVDAAGILEKTTFVKHTAKIPKLPNQGPSGIVSFFKGVQNTGDNLVEIVNTFPEPTKHLKNDFLWGKMFSGKTNINAAFSLVNENFSQAVFNNTTPTAIIWGEQDPVAPLRTGKLLAGQLPNASLTIIPEAGHVPMKSHTEEFNQALIQALKPRNLQTNPPEAKAQKHLVLNCDSQKMETFSGSYAKVHINNCLDINLKSMQTGEIEIINSRVTLEDIEVISQNLGLSIKDSVVKATNISVVADQGIYVDKSRIDIAGANITAKSKGITFDTKSRAIFSISQLQSPLYQGNLHGLFTLKKTSLDKKLKKSKK